VSPRKRKTPPAPPAGAPATPEASPTETYDKHMSHVLTYEELYESGAGLGPEEGPSVAEMRSALHDAAGALLSVTELLMTLTDRMEAVEGDLSRLRLRVAAAEAQLGGDPF
jgi:hypothetical protein